MGFGKAAEEALRAHALRAARRGRKREGRIAGGDGIAALFELRQIAEIALVIVFAVLGGIDVACVGIDKDEPRDVGREDVGERTDVVAAIGRAYRM